MSTYARKAVCIAVAACLLIAMGGVALACCCPCEGKGAPPDPKEMGKRIGEKLDKLVADKTITADQSAQIKKFFQEKDKQRREEFEKMKGMTPEERKAFMDEKRQGPPPDMAAELEKEVGLTPDTAKAVADALRPPAPPQKNR